MADIGKLGFAIDSRQVVAGKQALDAMARSAGKAGTGAKNAKGQFKKLNKETKTLNSQLLTLRATLVTLGAGVVMRQIINTHREFGKAISNLSAITGATENDLKLLTLATEEYGSTTTLTASQVAEAFKLVASAKPDLLSNLEALKAVTRETITLAEAATIDVPAAARVLGMALNQFGLSADKARETINILAAGAKFGSSEITETAVAIQKSGVVANAAGISFLELNAAIQTLAKSGQKSEIAGTGLRGAILKLSVQSKSDFNPSILGLATAFENLGKAGLTSAEKMKLFGLEGITVGQALMDNTDLLRHFEVALKDTNTAIEQAATNVDNFDGDMLALGSAFEGLAIKIGKTFDPALRSAAQGTTGFLRVMSETYDELSLSSAKASWILRNFWDVFTTDEAKIKAYKQQLKEIDDLFKGVSDPSDSGESEITKKTFVESNKRIAIYANETSKRKANDEKALKSQIKTSKELSKTFNQDLLGMQMTVAGQSASILRLVAGGNKEALIAALAIEKGMAATRIMMNSAVAKTAAIASYVGDPAGLAVAMGTIDSLTAASLGLVAASGLIQAGQITKREKDDGQFHSGNPFVEQTGSFTISRGERILETKTNKDLTDFLKRESNGNVSLVVNVDASGTNDEEVIRRAAEIGAQQGYEKVANDLRRGGTLQRQIGG